MSNIPYIGSLNLVYPCKYLNKSQPVVLGNDTRTRSGDMVSLRAETQSQANREIKVMFEWEPYSSVELLYEMWLSGESFYADLEGNGTVIQVRFAAKDGVANVKHVAWDHDVVLAEIEGEEVDLHAGELNLIKV